MWTILLAYLSELTNSACELPPSASLNRQELPRLTAKSYVQERYLFRVWSSLLTILPPREGQLGPTASMIKACFVMTQPLEFPPRTAPLIVSELSPTTSTHARTRRTRDINPNGELDS